MLCVETIGKIRRYRLVAGKSIKAISRELRLSRNTVRRVLRERRRASKYERRTQPRPRLGAYVERLEGMLAAEEAKPRAERRRVVALVEELRRAGYGGAHDSVHRYVRAWRRERRSQPAQAFVPLAFAPGEAYQFDWSHEQVELGGLPQTVKVAHLRLAHSRMFLVIAYPREAQEMVFDAHGRAFEFFGGVPRRGIYDNLKTAVDAILRGKDRRFNRRFLALCAHYLVEPIACTPAAGWEKGQVENQVGNVREWLFRPRPKFETLAELNAWLKAKCVEIAQSRAHPESRSRTVWEVFQGERGSLLVLPAPFDGYREEHCRVSATSLIRFDRNRYSVNARAVGQMVIVHVYAERIEAWLGGERVAKHGRVFGRDQTIYDPWHYVPVLVRKPGALRNGAPFADWVLPGPLERVRRELARHRDADRQFVTILAAVMTEGLAAVSAACQEALAQKTVSADAVLNLLARARDGQRSATNATPQWLTLERAPRADVERYDTLLRHGNSAAA